MYFDTCALTCVLLDTCKATIVLTPHLLKITQLCTKDHVISCSHYVLPSQQEMWQHPQEVSVSLSLLLLPPHLPWARAPPQMR